MSPRTLQQQDRPLTRKNAIDINNGSSSSSSPPPPQPPIRNNSMNANNFFDKNRQKILSPTTPEKNLPPLNMFNIANIPPSIFHQKIRINHTNNNNNNYNNDDDNDDGSNHLDSLPYYCEKQRPNNRLNRNHDDDNFSDDSLEGVSLPPQPPPPVVPPPPTLSAPATPNKRSSIAWEIMLEDKNTKNEHARKQSAAAIIDCEKVFHTSSQRSTSISNSETSLAETSENSTNCTKSADWAAVLPDVPICSTEDEAASLHSDSADDLIPYPCGSFKGQGTFVIKGPKKRHRLSDVEASFLSHQNSDSANTTIVNVGSPSIIGKQHDHHHPSHPHHKEKFEITANTIFTNAQVVGLPFSRHSIDLGSPQPVQNFPR